MKHTIVALIFSTIINLLNLMVGGVFAGTMDEMITERIKPVGSLCMAGENCAGPAQASARPFMGIAGKSVAMAKRSGKEIYDANCTGCHSNGAVGAPIVGSNEAAANEWAPRISKGIEALFTSAIGGINAMPAATSLCRDCIEDEIKATVCYMVKTSVPDSEITNETKEICATVEDDT